MAAWEPQKAITSHELGFVVEIVGRTQDIANAVVAMARTSMLHADFAGRLCKEGNMAFPFSPSDIELGRCTASASSTWSRRRTRTRCSRSNTRR
ncbi:hypothetical protein [Methylobacterium sp. XJLW]|uniref:hypothetical protein n=1 Tax=Methylobacterium sp. XJLW TaxID=739141 RepID=UPI00197BB3B8|nr:hypothetical protein [Methylobacterium sp. XJLW]